jgi:hypothetical protein
VPGKADFERAIGERTLSRDPASKSPGIRDDVLRASGSSVSGWWNNLLLLTLLTLAPDIHAAEVPRFLGSRSCASAMCHGGASEKQNQFMTWSQRDFHTRAPATLTMARSARISETLKIADAATDVRCTVCHNPFQSVPAARKGPLVGALEGVSCESCHNAAEPWLLTHTRTDLTHDQKVAAGLRDLKQLYVRANTCVACHQNLDPELRAAGHPELLFELDGQCTTMPRHWRETNSLRGAQAWFVGQAVALREVAAANPATEENRQRAGALAWLLGVAAEQKAADDLARRSASEKWSETETRAQLNRLAATHPEFLNAKAPAPELARRAETVALGLERLLVALRWQKQADLSTRLDQLFKDVQSRPDFEAKIFATHLKEFEAALPR